MEFESVIFTKNCSYNWSQIEPALNKEAYNRFVNWVTGEFDLYQKQESSELKVYFPTGWFEICKLNTSDQRFDMEIKVEGNSKVISEKITRRLIDIFNHIKRFQKLNNN